MTDSFEPPVRRARWFDLVLGSVGVAALAVVVVWAVRSGDEGGASDSNSATREALAEIGVDANGALDYTHYLYFDSQPSSNSAARELSGRFEVTVLAPSGGIAQWAVVAVERAELDADALDALTRRLDDVAQRFDGEYDGWEVAVEN